MVSAAELYYENYSISGVFWTSLLHIEVKWRNVVFFLIETLFWINQ